MKKYISALAVSVAIFAPTLFAHAATISTGVQGSGGTITGLSGNCSVYAEGIWYIFIDGGQVWSGGWNGYDSTCPTVSGISVPYSSGYDISTASGYSSAWGGGGTVRILFRDMNSGSYVSISNLVITGTSGPAMYSLAYSPGANGTLTGSTTQSVASGSDGSAVHAVANSGYHFTAWSDSSTQNPRTDLNVLANLAVTANFATTTSGGGGSGGGSTGPCNTTGGFNLNATDTSCIFQQGAAAVKSGGLAILNVAVPYVASAAVCFGVIAVFMVVAWLVKRHYEG